MNQLANFQHVEIKKKKKRDLKNNYVPTDYTKIDGQVEEKDPICPFSEGEVGKIHLIYLFWQQVNQYRLPTALSLVMEENGVKDWRRRDKEIKRQSKYIQM